MPNLAAVQLDSPSINPQQVERIGSVHRGFLYQHLYAVACMLGLGRDVGSRTIIERDEDVEVLTNECRYYVQIKTRGRPLQQGDVAEALTRFDQIRMAHSRGLRSGNPLFAIASNTEPGPQLAQRLQAKDWPSDVTIITPNSPHSPLPPAWRNIDAAIDWCVSQARETPFVGLSPDTLVWKLAALVQYAATGARARTFYAEEMPSLLEQLVFQLQDFPEPPSTYRPHQDEPPLLSGNRIRLLVGFSGAGKTAWASQAALHSADPLIYFDLRDLAAASAGSALARELAARFLGGAQAGISSAVLAERSGLGALRACAAELQAGAIRPTVVLDNCHRVSARALQDLMEAATNVSFVCLAQPWSGIAELGAALQVEPETLRGWSEHQIAAEFRSEDCPISYYDSERLLRATGGLPLYVKGAARVVKGAYSGHASAFLAALESRTHVVELTQEIILREAFEQLSAPARVCSGVLGQVDVPLTGAETLDLLAAANVENASAAAAIRELRRTFSLSYFHGDRLSLHDSLRPLAAEAWAELAGEVHPPALMRLYEFLSASLIRARDVPRLSSALRLLPRTGQSLTLAELAGDEMFYEQGDPRTLRSEVMRVADSDEFDPRDRFWALDSLVYWDSRDGGVPSRDRVRMMSELIAQFGSSEREQMALAFKQMVLFASHGNRHEVEKVFAGAKSLGTRDNRLSEMLHYNYAVALFRLGDFERAMNICARLIADYYRSLGMREAEVIGKNQVALLQALPNPIDYGRLKRLADSLSLWSTARVRLGQHPMLRRIHAAKFYVAAQAARSAIQAGLEAVDDFLHFLGDPVGALQTMEQNVLPLLQESGAADLIVPVRSHYAVTLAWNGRFGEARAEMEGLRTFSGSPEEQRMLAERGQHLEEIALGRVRLAHAPPQGESIFLPGGGERARRTVGRNEPCPCGSGLKFKKCHGS